MSFTGTRKDIVIIHIFCKYSSKFYIMIDMFTQYQLYGFCVWMDVWVELMLFIEETKIMFNMLDDFY